MARNEIQCAARLITLTGILIASSQALAADPTALPPPNPQLSTTGKVDAVTVYRGQALVTRLIDVPGPAGLREIVVGDLPEHVVPDSLYAEPGSNMTVRSVSYRTRPVTEDVREEVRKLEEQMQSLQDQIHAAQRNIEVLGQQKAYLDRLEQFTATSATTDLQKSALNPESIKDMTRFIFEQRQAIAKQDLDLATKIRDLNQQLQLVQRQHQKISTSSSKTAREAVIFIDLQQPESQVKLHYLVDGATWSPSYNMRGGESRRAVTVEYQASVQQMSGEDWSDVRMTLSTATPSLVSEAPALLPLAITLQSLSDQSAAQTGDYEKAWASLKQRKADIDNTRGQFRHINVVQQGQANKVPQAPNVNGQIELDRSLNEAASDEQIFEFAVVGKVAKPSAGAVRPTEGLSVTYALDGRTSLPSRADQQLIRIASLDMPADFYKVASPVLTEYVYEEAALRNDSKFVLLAGPVSAYLADQFVGHGDIPTVTIGERFTAGFGIDSSLRASRQLIDKTDSIQGGNRVVQLTYRLSLQNFANDPATVRVMDRMPKTKDSQVQVSMVSTKPELSKDDTYQRTAFKDGILRWDIQVPAQSTGPDAVTVEYSLRLEYDKQMTIGGLADARK